MHTERTRFAALATIIGWGAISTTTGCVVNPQDDIVENPPPEPPYVSVGGGPISSGEGGSFWAGPAVKQEQGSDQIVYPPEVYTHRLHPGCCQGQWVVVDGNEVFQCDDGHIAPHIWELETIRDSSNLNGQEELTGLYDPNDPLYDPNPSQPAFPYYKMPCCEQWIDDPNLGDLGRSTCGDGFCVRDADGNKLYDSCQDPTAHPSGLTRCYHPDQNPTPNFPEHLAAEGDDARGVMLHSVWFDSWEWTEQGPQTVKVNALMGVPDDLLPGEKLPAMVIGHGLRGQAERFLAISYARRLRMITIAISAPGNGRSEGQYGTADGRGGSVCHLIVQDPTVAADDYDPRSSFLYAYAVTGMRAVTYLHELTDGQANQLIDTDRIAVAGASAGGLLSMLLNGIDRRIAAAVPASATGHLELALNSGQLAALIEATGGPLAQLNGEKDCSHLPGSELLQKWLDHLAPEHYAPTACGPIFYVNGLQDELFPVNTTVATYEAWRQAGKDVWLDVLPDYDHDFWFDSANTFPAFGDMNDPPYVNLGDGYPNECVSVGRSAGNLGYWLHHHVLGTAGFDYRPDLPVLAVTPHGDGTTTFEVVADQGNASISLANVVLRISRDRACTVEGHDMAPGGQPGQYSVTVQAVPEEVVYWAEVEYDLPSTGLMREDFRLGGQCSGPIDVMHLSTAPVLPPGFVPQVRPLNPFQGNFNCQP